MEKAGCVKIKIAAGSKSTVTIWLICCLTFNVHRLLAAAAKNYPFCIFLFDILDIALYNVRMKRKTINFDIACIERRFCDRGLYLHGYFQSIPDYSYRTICSVKELKSIYRREKKMIKKYRLCIELTRDIDVSFQGIKDKEVRSCSREIVKCLLENPDLLTSYYKTITAQYWLSGELEEHEYRRLIEEEDQIWLKLLKKVPPTAVGYLKYLIYGDSYEKDENDEFIIDERKSLIYNCLGFGDVTDWDFREMGIDEKLSSPWFSGNHLNQNNDRK